MSDTIDVQVITLSRVELYGLLNEAARRGAEQALAKVKAAASPPGQLVNRKAMAELLSVSVATLDRFVLQGMPYVRVGQHRKFNRDDVMAWHHQRGGE